MSLSLDEIKAIFKEYNSGPIVKKAGEEALRWAEAYRKFAIISHSNLGQPSPYSFGDGYTTEERETEVDAEAKRIKDARD